MGTLIKSAVVVPLLLWALLLPKASAILLDLNPNIDFVVICTGTEMISMRIDADGNPVEIEHVEDAPCVMADPNSIKQAKVPDWTLLAREYKTSFVVLPNASARHDAVLDHRRSQAPPLV